jgi:hypothetical protein
VHIPPKVTVGAQFEAFADFDVPPRTGDVEIVSDVQGKTLTIRLSFASYEPMPGPGISDLRRAVVKIVLPEVGQYAVESSARHIDYNPSTVEVVPTGVQVPSWSPPDIKSLPYSSID